MKTKTYGMFALPALAAIMVVGTIGPAFAADPLGSNGENWGAATAFFAEHQGEHASSQEEPRTGLGNLKNSFDGDWCGVLDFLNDFDDESVLTCAEQE